MNIKAKLTLMTGIPLAGLIAIVILGWAGFNDFDTFLTDVITSYSIHYTKLYDI